MGAGAPYPCSFERAINDPHCLPFSICESKVFHLSRGQRPPCCQCVNTGKGQGRKSERQRAPACSNNGSVEGGLVAYTPGTTYCYYSLDIFQQLHAATVVSDVGVGVDFSIGIFRLIVL